MLGVEGLQCRGHPIPNLPSVNRIPKVDMITYEKFWKEAVAQPDVELRVNYIQGLGFGDHGLGFEVSDFGFRL